MEEIVKQERHKLHMVSDNLLQMIQILKDRDEKRFSWAWGQIENNLTMGKTCFLGMDDDLCKSIDQLYEDHSALLEKRVELQKKLEKNPDISTLTDEEIGELEKLLNDFVEDMSKRFDLGEFEE